MKPAVLLEMTAEPAFASDENGNIVAWNAAAERVLGYRAQEVLGKPCREITCGIDAFGNRYCREDCNPRQMLARGEPIHGFEIDVRAASGAKIRAEFSILVVRGPRASQFTLVHIMKPALPQAEAGANEPVSEPSVAAERASADAPTLQSEPDPAPFLTTREREVLTLLAEGVGTAEIARSLFISANTVRTHVENLFRKLDAHSQLEAVAIARRKRLIPDSPKCPRRSG